MQRAGLLAALAALAALGVAYFAQDVLQLVPCPLCLWERWPYRLVIALGITAFVLPRGPARFLLAIAALAMFAGAGIAFLHVGVEVHWWRSPLPECNAFLTPGAALPLHPAPPCDSPTYLISGLPVSMAAMDMIYALAFAIGLSAYVSRKPRRFK